MMTGWNYVSALCHGGRDARCEIKSILFESAWLEGGDRANYNVSDNKNGLLLSRQ
jgi:hypothetical protein